MGDEQKPPDGGQPEEPPQPAGQATASSPQPDPPAGAKIESYGSGNQFFQGNFKFSVLEEIAGASRGDNAVLHEGVQLLGGLFGKAVGKEFWGYLTEMRTAAEAATASAPPTGSAGGKAPDGTQDHGAFRLPETDDKVDEWFLALDARGRCAVRAMAVLNGAPAHEVARAREELYEALEAKRAPTTSAGPAAAPVPERPPSARELLAATYSEARVVNGATRLYWRSSADQTGAAFGQRVLALLAGEIGGTRGVPGENVRDQITVWATRGTGERRWRAARALGVIWWQQHQAELESQGREWATAASDNTRESAAGLIFGAYETESEQVKPAQQTEQTGERKSRLKTLDILTRWSDLAFARASDQGLVQAVATADLFISHENPEAALDGLDYLLQLDAASESRDDHTLTFGAYALALLAYVTLAWMGETRRVVARLAAHAERLVCRPRPPSIQAALRKADVSARERRERNLFAITFIWFLLVVSSDGSIDGATGSDGLTLPDKLIIPDEHGRNPLLLAVLLDHETILRQHIVKLMAAAFCDTGGPLASEALHRWAIVVARSTAPDVAVQAEAAFTRFLIAIGQQTRRWDTTTGAMTLNAGFNKFQNLLRHWPRGTRTGLPKSEQEAERKAAEMAETALRQLAITADATASATATTTAAMSFGE